MGCGKKFRMLQLVIKYHTPYEQRQHHGRDTNNNNSYKRKKAITIAVVVVVLVVVMVDEEVVCQLDSVDNERGEEVVAVKDHVRFLLRRILLMVGVMLLLQSSII